MFTNIEGVKEVLVKRSAPVSSGLPAPSAAPKKRNLIFMVSDGMGPASLSLTRTYRQFVEKLPINDTLTLDKHFIGSSRTMSSDSYITDSAAGATAFSCGIKTYNNAIGIYPNQTVCGTILEAAKLNGYMTGLVVTTRITDATPAAFSAHANYRQEEDLIAQQQLGEYPLGRMVDLMMGGGRCHFQPTSIKGGCRADSRNLIDEAKSRGWSYVSNVTEFKALNGGNNVSLPLLGLFTPKDIPFEIDRKPEEYPSLEETTKTAIRALEKATANSTHGFFLMIEGSRIDHAGHNNDAAAQVREVLAYDKAFKAAVDFAASSNVETIVISTSDHETGGLSVARQIGDDYPEYLWKPSALANATHSGEYLSGILKDFKNNGTALESYIKTTIFEQGLGIKNFTSAELNKTISARTSANDVLVDMVSRRSLTGWSTHGHSAVDVNIYAYTNGMNKTIFMDKLAGNRENFEIGLFMESYLGLNLRSVTDILLKNPFNITGSGVKPKD